MHISVCLLKGVTICSKSRIQYLSCKSQISLRNRRHYNALAEQAPHNNMPTISFPRMALGKYLQNLKPIPQIQHLILPEKRKKVTHMPVLGNSE